MPYLLRTTAEEVRSRELAFELLNTSRNNTAYFFTFETPGDMAINQVRLDFEQSNFDWNVRLEGSSNQNEWFTLLEDYRIVGIRNERTIYQFTTLNFPDAKTDDANNGDEK